MTIDDETLVQDPEVVEGTETTEAPETRESIVEGAVADAELQGRLDDLAEAETEPTVESLRTAFGDLADGLTDEELQAEWDKARGGTEGTEAGPYVLPNGLKLYGEDGKELTDLSKMTLQQALDAKVQWGYNALGKEQKKALTEVFRNASLGHYNEQKMQTLQQERTQAYEAWKQLSAEHESWAQDRQVWLGVLTAASQGNIEPLKQLIKAYGEQGGSQPMTQETVDPRQEAEFNQAGIQWVNTEANRLATLYGANPLEIAQTIMYMANQEPKEFLTKEKLEAIVQYEIPALLERYNYSQTAAGQAASADPRDVEIATLKKQMAELTAGKTNAATQKVRDRAKKVPAAGGGRTPVSGASVPSFKTREDYKKWIRDEE
jgi:hypothetical protein